MRKLRALIGMPVVRGNRRIGRALRGELAEDLRQLEGIWFSAGLRGTRYIPVEELEMLGQVAVLADGEGRRGHMRSQPLLMRAVSTDGRRLGAITGAEIDEISFQVLSLELSAGFWDDLLRQRQQITRFTVNRESGEVIVEPAEDERDESDYEGRTVEGPGHRHADRRLGGDDLRRNELADRAEVEPEGKANGKLDL